MSGRHWTHAEERQLRELMDEGATKAEAAEELGRSLDAVQNRASALRLRSRMGPRPNVIKRAWVLDRLAAGWSVNEIARCLRRNSSPLNRMVRRMERDGLVKRIGTGTATVYVPRSYRD